MSTRTTAKWTATAEEALGESAVAGRHGEMVVLNAFRNRGYVTIDHESSKWHQTRGIDLTANICGLNITIDVKTNYHNGVFYVYREWITDTNKSNQSYIHVNIHTGEMASYSRREMQDHFKTAVGDRITISKHRPESWPTFVSSLNLSV